MELELVPNKYFRFPAITMPSFIQDIEEMLPTNNYMNGLSVFEDEKNVYVEAAVPGVTPDKVEVTFDKGVVTIRGDKEEEKKEKKFHRKATSSFFYRVEPGDIDIKNEPTAVYKNGVMKVTFSKSPDVKPKKIAVKTAE